MAGSGTAHLRDGDDLLLRVRELVVDFPVGRKEVLSAVAGVSFDITRSETLGLVGESGCGKSTTARSVLMLPPPTTGSIRFDGHDLAALKGEALRRVRPDLQVVFQDPVSSLNPRSTVRRLVREGLDVWQCSDDDDDLRDRVDQVLLDVGLDPHLHGDRRPHELSGGQCQRVSIARALVLRPKLLVCDEPVSALDVSVQAQILNLLSDLKRQYGFALLFVAHDLAVIHNIADRVAVMYMGKLCEIGTVDQVFASPQHPYTRVLLEAVPVPDPTVPMPTHELSTELPSPVNPPSGCRFRTRCPVAVERCATEEPVMRNVAGRYVACHVA